MKHTIHIRDLDHDTYEKMWNLRKRFKARSWSKLLQIVINKVYREEVENWIE